jgi:hypothetical protein
MKRLEGPDFDPYRVPIPLAMQLANPGARADNRSGAFVFKDPVLGLYSTVGVFASAGGGWDHVSVSTATRCPVWEEMEWVKRRFFKQSETAMQLHVTSREHVNIHPYTLHLWRPHKGSIPLPPKGYV